MRRTNPNTDPSAMLGVLGDAAFAWLAAGRDFLGHTLEIGARHAEETIRSAMAPMSGGTSNRVDALVNRYQRFLSDLGLTVPLAAQTFRRHLDDSKAPRLLFRSRDPFLVDAVNVPLKLSQPLFDGLTRIEAFPKKEDCVKLKQGLCKDAPLSRDELENLCTNLSGMRGLAIDPDIRKSLIGTLGEQAERCISVLERLINLKQALNYLPVIRRSIPNPSLDEQQKSILDFLRHLQWALPLEPKTLKHKLGRRLQEFMSEQQVRRLFAPKYLEALQQAIWQEKDKLNAVDLLHDSIVRTKDLDFEQRFTQLDRVFRCFESSLTLSADMSLHALLADSFAERGDGIVKLIEFLEETRVVLADNAQRVYELLDALKEAKSACCDMGLEETFLTQFSSVRRAWEQAELDTVRKEFCKHGIHLSERVSIVGGRNGWTVTDHEMDSQYAGVVDAQAKQVDVIGPREGLLYSDGGSFGTIHLPLRVRSARQGFVVYSVDRDIVQGYVNSGLSANFRAWDSGARRTPVVIFIVDYLDTDIGPYKELGIGCFVAPKDDPLALGMHILALPVSEMRSVAAGQAIWRYPKKKYQLDFDYSNPTEVTCALRAEQARHERQALVLRLTLPREGDGSSVDIPFNSYTNKDHLCFRTVFTRSGSGEAMRAGGSVKLIVEKAAPAGDQPSRQYAGPPSVWEILDAFELRAHAFPDSRKIMFSGWTEHMSGAFSAPVALSERWNSSFS